MKFLVILAAVMLAGCSLDSHDYRVKFIKPDGDGYRLITVSSPVKPHLVAYDGIVVLRVAGDQDYLIPAGWMVEVEPQTEKE